jgi:hypothetical protein
MSKLIGDQSNKFSRCEVCTAVLLQKLRELLIHRKIVKLNRAVGQLKVPRGTNISKVKE